MDNYGTYKIICPFYKDETKNAIRCEGFISDTSASSVSSINAWESSKIKKDYQKKYCRTFHYGMCVLAQELLKKYNRQDNEQKTNNRTNREKRNENAKSEAKTKP